MADRGISSTRRWVIAGAVLVFLVVDVILVLLAFRVLGASEDSAVDYIDPLATAEPTPAPTATAEPSPAPPPSAAPRPDRILAALDATIAWRAAAQSCDAGPGVAEVTLDAGAEWLPANVGAISETQGILALSVVDSTMATAIVTDDACSPLAATTFSAGTDWVASADERLDGEWFVAPGSDTTLVHSPTGVIAAPCEVSSLAALSTDQAAVLCTDTRLFRTTDTGASWDASVPVAGGSAITVTDDAYVLGLMGGATCAGLTTAVFDAIASPSDGTLTGCLGAAFGPGQTALSWGEGTLWAWVGSTLSRSDDLGATWY